MRDLATVSEHMLAREQDRDNGAAAIDWHVATGNARTKLKSLQPKI